MTVYTPRRAARVLLVDAAGRVLLFNGFDPARPGHRYWFTSGGGLDPAESPAAGAARELAEETGLRLDPAELGEPVWSETAEFPFDGVWYRQQQMFFLVRVSSWQVDTAGFDDVERRSIAGHRWWSPEELAATDERYYPAELPALLTRLLQPTAGVGRDEGSC
ncbi:NUDIX hydrolase [Micromonospora cremea]|uniref:ADP-ribose pyrophosphatase YjhB, NUDIX family n=1 Tax=Micromonospora cremea TaxID=709881 RepID=A0A1N6AVU2_9ACTN|nr:NUDIX domain-containing protein [Micromonospora cremea]SIN38034.1 ADP-ribose pyrophosphatase YjhB, NUDIX family [Micromonospora cremea]